MGAWLGRQQQDDGESQPLLELSFAQVQHEELEVIRKKQKERDEDGNNERRTHFALAFSGGGIRAAAFQSGVLWRLAQAGHLKDVEYFSAVSGGAYIAAAFASHTQASLPPQRGEPLDKWYRSVVAKTICRMQDNAGEFVRDPGKVDSKNNSGLLPPIFDLPLLLLMFIFTIIIVPAELLIVYVIPITEGIYLFFGAALRLTVCSQGTALHIKILRNWSPFQGMEITLAVCLGLTFFFWLLSQLPLCQLREKPVKDQPRFNGYLWVMGARATCMRAAIFLALLMIFLIIVPTMQLFSYGEAMRTLTNNTAGGFCMQYMSMGGTAVMRQGAEFGCANMHDGRTWYKSFYRVDSRKGAITELRSFMEQQEAPGADPWTSAKRRPEDILDVAGSVLHQSKSILSFFFSILAFVLVVSTVLVPFFPDLFLAILWITGPVLAFVLVAILLQYRIFGPLTGQPLMFDWFPFQRESWHRFVKVCLIMALAVIPFFNDLRRGWHWFYVRSLRMSFFAAGADLDFAELARNPYCPLMIFTGTVSDYTYPGTKESISEISFSPMHTGSEITGYLRTPRYRTLAKCTALTGAGCLDAITLSIRNHLRFRFWLELLNLSWGDYIMFVRRENRIFQYLAKLGGKQLERPLLWILHRLPTLCIWFVIWCMVFGGWLLTDSVSEKTCKTARNLMSGGFFLVCCLFGISFLGFTETFSWVLFSPIIRQFHQATQFFFQGYTPPPLLYVTDGGVKDCTSIVQLIRRRCERILLVLASSDPNDEFAVLRTTMEVTVSERLACFYDPEDPKRDVQMLLENFRHNSEQKYMHIGIRFGWGEATEEAVLGTLIIVKMRLPPSLSNMPVRPLLTEEELNSETGAACGWGVSATADKHMKGLRMEDLGGLGCCDCCHRNGCNCGAKFPHLTGANYLWLTPQLFSGLCRLGHELSDEAIQRIIQ